MSDVRRFSGLVFDPADGRLAAADGSHPPACLRPQVARLLLVFLDAPNQVLARERLAAEVWDDRRIVDFEAGLSALIRELRLALGETGGDPAMIETVPRRGYRFLVEPTAPVAVEQASAIAPDRAGNPPRAATRIFALPISMTVSVTVVITIAVVIAIWVWPGSPGSSAPVDAASAPLRLAVLPFARYRDEVELPESELRAADAMLAALWKAGLERVELIGRTSLAPYAGASNVAERVAEDLNASLILEGSVSEQDASWRIDVRLLRLPGGSVIWSGTRIREADAAVDVWVLAEDLVAELARDWSGTTLGLALHRE